MYGKCALGHKSSLLAKVVHRWLYELQSLVAFNSASLKPDRVDSAKSGGEFGESLRSLIISMR